MIYPKVLRLDDNIMSSQVNRNQEFIEIFDKISYLEMALMDLRQELDNLRYELSQNNHDSQEGIEWEV